MGRRELRAGREGDPPTAVLAADRLAHLLTEHAPRRAATDAGPDRPDGPDGPDGPPTVTRRRAGPPGRPAGPERAGLLGGFGRPQLGVICAVLVGALALAGWSLLRARPVAVATPLAVTTSASSGKPTTTASPPPTPAAEPILVHVLGAVHRPGVVSLPMRARVADAIRKAGGLTPAADPAELNLAQILSDGQQIVIGTKANPAGLVRDGSGGGSPTAGSAAAGGGAAGPVLDLNSATAGQLDQLPGVGPVTADRILAWRSAHGRFSRVEELQEVDGIGPKTYGQIAPHVRV